MFSPLPSSIPRKTPRTAQHKQKQLNKLEKKQKRAAKSRALRLKAKSLGIEAHFNETPAQNQKEFLSLHKEAIKEGIIKRERTKLDFEAIKKTISIHKNAARLGIPKRERLSLPYKTLKSKVEERKRTHERASKLGISQEERVSTPYSRLKSRVKEELEKQKSKPVEIRSAPVHLENSPPQAAKSLESAPIDLEDIPRQTKILKDAIDNKWAGLGNLEDDPDNPIPIKELEMDSAYLLKLREILNQPDIEELTLASIKDLAHTILLDNFKNERFFSNDT